MDILQRQAILNQFENKLKDYTFSSNFLIDTIWYGYVISQLSDCRKFFDRNSDTYNFNFITKHITDKKLRNKHALLFSLWKQSKLENVTNKYLLHSNKESRQVILQVKTQTLNSFIEQLKKYIEDVTSYLSRNHMQTSFLCYENYIKEVVFDVDIFFKKIKSD